MLDINKLPRLQPNSAGQFAEKRAKAKEIAAFFTSSRGIVVLFIFIFVLASMLNLYAERRLKAQVYAVFKEIGANGFGVSYRIKSSFADFTGGVHLDGVVLTAPAKMGGWELKTSRLNVSANPLTGKIGLKFSGTHSLKTKTAADIRFIIGEGEAVIQKSPAVLSVSVKNIQTASPQNWTGFTVGDIAFHAEKTVPSALSFDLTVNRTTPPAALVPPLSPTADYLYLKGSLPASTDDDGTPLLTKWLNGGGIVEIGQAELIWQPFMAQLSGTIGFDDGYEPTAAAVGKVYGFFDFLDKLAQTGTVSQSQVSLAKIVLGERVKQAAGEVRPSLSSAFSLQNGKVYAGQVPLN